MIFPELVVRLLLGLFLFGSALAKIWKPSSLVVVLSDVLPLRLAYIGRWVVLGTELALGTILLVPPLPAQIGGLLATVFLACATGFVFVRMLRRAEFSCGCWGETSSAKGVYYRDPQQIDASWTALSQEIVRPMTFAIRNSLLLLGSCWLWLGPAKLGPAPLIAAGTAVPFAIGCGLMVDVALRRSDLRLPVHPLRSVMLRRARPLIAMSWYGTEFLAPEQRGLSGTRCARTCPWPGATRDASVVLAVAVPRERDGACNCGLRRWIAQRGECAGSNANYCGAARAGARRGKSCWAPLPASVLTQTRFDHRAD